MCKIFISYKRQDKNKVFPIVEKIKQKTGVDCWIDLSGIESGDQFQNVIINAIENADVVVFMLSKNFVAPYKDEKTGKIDLKKQTFPQKEVMYALNEGKRLVPVSIDGTTVNDCKWLKFNCGGTDFIKWSDADQRQKFFRDISTWLNTNENPDENPLIHKSFLTILDRNRNKLNFLPLLLSVILLIFVIVDKSNASTYISAGLICSLITFVLMIGAIFNKRLFGLNKSYQAFTYYIPALLIFFISFVVAICNKSGKTQESNEPVPVVSIECVKPVDLGLPSGTLWADRNVGAKSIEDYGNLYAWGEVMTKNDYSDIYYNDVNIYEINGTEYDIATAEFGEEWQMPSVKQFDELINECKWEWENNGVRVVGKNGNYIFLPASGWICNSVVEHKNEYGYYWSRNKVNPKFAKGLLFSKSEHYTGNFTLHYGRTVRAVKTK